jgi:hypothetical protein
VSSPSFQRLKQNRHGPLSLFVTCSVSFSVPKKDLHADSVLGGAHAETLRSELRPSLSLLQPFDQHLLIPQYILALLSLNFSLVKTNDFFMKFKKLLAQEKKWFTPKKKVGFCWLMCTYASG